MFNNKLLDWKFDNGISTYMTTDKDRNQFMDRVLARTVKDKNCLDIGFGTGLLSFLAVKHGAKHVTAFEFNYERYLLGQYLIEKMGLQDQTSI
jgi:predicted RNA methylase